MKTVEKVLKDSDAAVHAIGMYTFNRVGLCFFR
jgi:hypothetical protein